MSELIHDETVINSVFRQHGVGARIARTHGAMFQSSASNVLTIERKPGVKVAQVVKLADEIDEALTDMRSTPIHCRFETLPLRVLTPRRQPRTPDVLDVIAKYAQHVKGNGTLQVLIGEVIKSKHAAPLFVDLTHSTTPHMLVAGTTGSGKTTALIDLVVSLSMLNNRRNLSIRVLDPKGVDLHVLDGLPGMEYGAVRDAEMCVDALRDVVAEMDRRKARGVADPSHRIVVVIDEMADLIAVAGDEVTAHMERILQAGRGLGIHVIGATQKPLSSIVGSLAKANFPFRLVGRVMSRNDANVAAGISDTGAERLPGLGAFVKVSASGVESVQAYAADKRRVAALARGSGQVVLQQQYQPKNEVVRSEDAIPPVNTGINTGKKLDFDVNRPPTVDEARVIRAWSKVASKNAVIREFFPTASKDKCLKFIDAALTRQEVNA